MAEEQRCQEPHILCANNCGFFGSPNTLNLCSKCYRDLRLKQQQADDAKLAVEKSLSPSPIPAASEPEKVAFFAKNNAPLTIADSASASTEAPVASAGPSRCSACRKRVGLSGFNCRCGAVFCGAHRYPEQHNCGFDYKGVGREELARANPVVKAAKLDKI